MKIVRPNCACFVAIASARLAVGIVVSLTLGSSARANGDIWKTATSGVWGTGTNWADNSTPGNGDQATFDKAGTYTVTYSADPAAIQDLFVSAGNVTLVSSSGTSRTLNVNFISPGGGQDVLISSGATLTLSSYVDSKQFSLNAGDDLHVQLGGVLNVNNGSQVASTDLIDNFGGTIVVDGFHDPGGIIDFPSYSTLNASASALVGAVGGTSTLTYRNLARGGLALAGTVNVGSGAAGALNIESDADVEVGSLNVGTGSAGTGTININSLGSSLTQTGPDTITVGAASGGIGTINVGTAISGAFMFTTGTGLTTVNATGTVNVGSASTRGTFSANGNVLLDGGTINVNGTASTFSQSGANTITVGTTFGGSGTLNVGTTGSVATFDTGIGVTTINSNGVVNVGSVSTSGTFNANGVLALSGTINVNGTGSTFGQSGGNTINVGMAFGGSGTLNVGTTTSGGTFNTATGLTTIYSNGVVNVGSASTGGTLNVNGGLVLGGNININGGTVNLQTPTVSGGKINFAGGSLSYLGNLTIGTGGIFGNGNVTFANNQHLTLTGTTTVDPAHSLTIGGSAVLTAAALQVNGGQLFVSSNGSVGGGPLSIAGGGLASFTGVANPLSTTITGSDSLLQLQGPADALDSGATWNIVSGGGLSLGGDFHLNSGNISVDGTGSTVVIAAAKTLRIGDVVGATTGVMNVTNDGSLTVGAGGTTLLTNHAALNINGGTADLKTLNNSGGTFNFTAGSLNYLGNLTVGTGGLLGSNLIVNADRQLTLSGTTTVDPSRALTLSGGTLNTGSLVVNGAFNFTAGTLGITQAGASINTPIVTGNTSTINISANNVSLGSAASFSGFNHQGILNVGSNIVALNSAGYAKLGVLTTLANGTINAPNGVVFASGSNFLGRGAVNSRVSGEAGSVIEASGVLVMGDAASPAGFNFGGEMRVGLNPVTLSSSSQVGLGNLTTLGTAASPGTLFATNGLVVDFNEAITGYGTVDSTNTLAKRTIINGLAQGNSMAQPLYFDGYVKGVGTFNNVSFLGTFSPGLSPAILTVGNLALAPSSTLIIELGGTTPGSQHDQIQASGTLALGGTLDVSLINGFTPVGGQQFTILTAGSIVNNGFVLSGSAASSFNLLVNSTSVILQAIGLAGDYNQNGIVDSADYLVWRKNVGASITLPNDLIGGTIGTAQYNQWRANFGKTAPGAGSSPGIGMDAAVPEPSTLVLLIFTAAVLHLRRGRAA